MFELAPSRKYILAIMAFTLIVMLGVAFMQRLSGEPLVVQGSTGGGAQNEEQNPMAAVMAEIGKHMEELRENPNDYDTLVHTSDLLVQTEQWEAAESFLRRAIAIDASKAQPHYLLGIVLHNNEKHEEAAASLEKVVAINADPSAMYSLGVLYIYYLNDAPRGLAHLEKALENKNLAADLRAAMEAEVKKVREGAKELAKPAGGSADEAQNPAKTTEAAQ